MQDKTILVSAARSGTNYFLDAYSKTFPDHLVLGEIFRKSGNSIEDLEKLLGLASNDVRALAREKPLDLWRAIPSASIAKIFYYHIDQDAEIWEHFRDNNRIVHLIRSDHLETFISLKVAFKSGVWLQKKVSFGQMLKKLPRKPGILKLWLQGMVRKPKEIQPFRLDPEELKSFIETRKGHIQWCRDFFVGADYHEVIYEDISASSDLCAKAVGQIYDVETNALALSTVKQSKGDPRALILNYDEIAEFDEKRRGRSTG